MLLTKKQTKKQRKKSSENNTRVTTQWRYFACAAKKTYKNATALQ